MESILVVNRGYVKYIKVNYMYVCLIPLFGSGRSAAGVFGAYAADALVICGPIPFLYDYLSLILILFFPSSGWWEEHLEGVTG